MELDIKYNRDYVYTYIYSHRLLGKKITFELFQVNKLKHMDKIQVTTERKNFGERGITEYQYRIIRSRKKGETFEQITQLYISFC